MGNRTNEVSWRGALRRSVASVSLLGAFGFLTDNVGHISPQLNQVLALLLLALFTSLTLTLSGVNVREARKKPAVLAITAFSLFVVLWRPDGEAYHCAAVTVFLAGLYLASQAFALQAAKLPPHLLAASLITLYVVLYKHVPQFWNLLQAASRLYSSTITRLGPDQLLLNTTASGFHILIFFILYVLSFFCVTRRMSWASMARLAGLGVLINAAYLVVHVPILIPFLRLFLNQYHLEHPHYHGYTITSLNTSLFFTAMLAAPLFLLHRGLGSGSPEHSDRTRKAAHRPREATVWPTDRVLIGASAALLGLFVLNLLPMPANAGGGTVVLYDKGYLDWKRPVFGRYGERSAGMFGMLPDYLAASGFSVRNAYEISDQSLTGADVLVIINLQNSFSPDEHEAIWRFVGNGGSLLALGDHTGLAGIREPFNDLLRPVGVEFNFDCAHYINDWSHAFDLFSHPVTRGITTDRELGISIGASLSIPPSVTPVVIGKYGFSDIGNANNDRNAYLGDRKYNEGELLGDVVLVAATDYGKGKVLVFGDTSTFQNSALVQAHRFVGRVFDWLTATGRLASPSAYLVLTGSILILAGVLLVMRDRRASLGVLPLSIAITIGVVVPDAVATLRQEDAPLKGNIACIDTSHLERAAYDFGDDAAFLGLSYNLMRQGFLPIEMSRFSKDQLRVSKLFVSIAPAQAFSDNELSTLKRFTAAGGTFLLCAGWEDLKGSEKLLSAFELGLDGLPLGPVDPDANTAGVQFYNAWPIRVPDPQSAEIVSSYNDPAYPLIVRRSYGSGQAILVGDSGFLRNANLESFRTYIPENIGFLRELLGPESGQKGIADLRERK